MKGFRFPRSVIGYPVWAYRRFALSFRDVDVLAERGITVSYETIQFRQPFRDKKFYPVVLNAEDGSGLRGLVTDAHLDSGEFGLRRHGKVARLGMRPKGGAGVLQTA